MIIRTHDGKVFLMLPHGCDQDFTWELKKGFVKGSNRHGRILHKMGNGVEQVIVRDHLTTQIACGFGYFSPDHVLAFCNIHYYIG